MSSKLEIGDLAPDFKLTTTSGILSLGDINKNIILYFYPKDDTPGCTQEAKGFAALSNEFEKLGVMIIGVSKDTLASHDKFKKKYELPFDLLSDKDGDLCEHYNVWGEKSFMGRKYMGIARETFLIGKDKKIKYIWRNVKAKIHPQEVLEEIKKLQL